MLESKSHIHNEVERLGYEARTKDNYVEARLPLFCSVRVYVGEDYCSVVPMIGWVHQRRYYYGSAVVLPLMVALFWLTGAIDVATMIFIAFIGLVGILVDSIRFLLSEQARREIEVALCSEKKAV